MKGLVLFAAAAAAVVGVMAALPSVYVDHTDVSRTRVYEDVLPPELYARMASYARAIAAYETGYTLKDNKKRTRWFPWGATPQTALEEAITLLRPLVKPDREGEVIAGCEWWVQLVNADEPIGFHLDKDESVASNKHYLVHPVYGTILYLSDVGGPTLIIDQFSPNGNGYEPPTPNFAELVYPKPNKFAIFKGHLLHGVVSGDHVPGVDPKTTKRLTFLMNWWTTKPEAPNCELIDHTTVKGLRLYSASEMVAFRQTFSASHKPKRIAIKPVDLFENGGGSPARVYPFKLPGGADTSVRLPANTERGASYTLRWNSKVKPAKPYKKAAPKGKANAKPKAEL